PKRAPVGDARPLDLDRVEIRSQGGSEGVGQRGEHGEGWRESWDGRNGPEEPHRRVDRRPRKASESFPGRPRSGAGLAVSFRPMPVEFSVVIPTHNRMDVLPEVLAAVEAQVGAPELEVVVVDDGSSDGTAEFLAGRSHKVPLRVLRQDNSGPAGARNAGVAAAVGGGVAFLGDDTVPAPGWLAAHARAHRRRAEAPRVAVLGYTGWHSRMRLNPFLRYINEHGLQFGYALIEDPEDVPFNFFYTSNVSLPRELLLAEPFDLRFPYAAWEDIEVAYRLKKRGLRLVYEKSASVAH